MQNLLIITGGISPERDISIASCENFINHIDKSKYNALVVDIIGKNDWVLQNTSQKVSLISKNDETILLNGLQETKIDLILPLIHGDGECGSLQGMLEEQHIKYLGTKMLGSVLCFDKVASKRIVQNFGIKVTPFIEWTMTYENYEQASKILQSKKIVVKPSRSGSSFGVSVVDNQADFEEAIEFAKKFDSEIVILEKYIENVREVFCGYLNDEVSKIGEVVVENHALFDYVTKYTNNGLSKFVEAKIDSGLNEKIQSNSMKICKLLRCENFARVDYFIDENNVAYFSEVNTIPGMTNKSLYIDLMKISGTSFEQVIQKILEGK